MPDTPEPETPQVNKPPASGLGGLTAEMLDEDGPIVFTCPADGCQGAEAFDVHGFEALAGGEVMRIEFPDGSSRTLVVADAQISPDEQSVIVTLQPSHEAEDAPVTAAPRPPDHPRWGGNLAGIDADEPHATTTSAEHLADDDA